MRENRKRTQKSGRLFGRKKAVLIAVVVIAALLVLSSAYLCYASYFDSDIASGVNVAGVELGGLQYGEAYEKLEKEFSGVLRDQTVTLQYNQAKTEFRLSDVDAAFDYQAVLDAADDVGKSGNPFRRMGELVSARVKGVSVEPQLSFDKEKLSEKLQPVQEAIAEPVTPYSAELDGGEIVVHRGKAGQVFDEEKLYQDILHCVKNTQELKITLETRLAEPEPVDVEKLYEQFYKEPQDARYTTVNHEMVLEREVVGVDFDKEEAARILEKGEDPCRIPVKFTEPQVKVTDLKTDVFGDTLGTYTTRYNAGDTARSTNVRIAAEKMNGQVIAPGEVFSYAGNVGHGSYAEGYVDAKVYVGGEITDGLAGGICQVSSTLYSAVLYADLEIVTRTNHSMPVSYLPAGQDATIAYPSIDFKFRNSTKYPIKVSAGASGGTLTISILGTNDDPGKKVTITNTTTSTIPFPTRTVETSSLSPGQERVKQNGSNGSVVNTYKTITRNGVTEKTEFVSTSRYSPIEKIVEVGVSGAPEQTPPPAEETPPPAEPAPETPEPPPAEVTPEPTPEPPAEPAPEETPAEQPGETPSEAQ